MLPNTRPWLQCSPRAEAGSLWDIALGYWQAKKAWGYKAQR